MDWSVNTILAAIYRFFRRGSMAAFSIDRDLQRIRVGLGIPRRDANHSGRKQICIMQRDSNVRFGEACEQTIFDHLLGAGNRFFCRLANEHQRPMPCVPSVSHNGGCSKQRRHVHVMPAGMHHSDVASGIVFRADFAGIGKTGLFFHRQRVQFRAQHDRGARAIFHNGHNAGAANVLRYVITQRPQAVRKLRRSPGFVGRKLRVLMQVKIKSLRVWKDGFNLTGERPSLCGASHRGKQQKHYRSDHHARNHKRDYLGSTTA